MPMRGTSFLLLLASLCVAISDATLTTGDPSRSGCALPIPTSLFDVRGGVLREKKDKRRALFGVFDKASSEPDLGPRSTSIHTESSVVRGSKSVDVEYKKALVKTVLTVSGAGEGMNPLFSPIVIGMCVYHSNQNLIMFFCSPVWDRAHGNKRCNIWL